jgi:NACalpha-BTF3-like transcription factor
MSEEVEVLEESHGNEASKALDSVTDYVADRELDVSKAQNALSGLQSQQAALLARQRREAQLAAVKVDPLDIQVIMKELDLDKLKADRMLREHNGDLYSTLKAFVSY